MNIDTALNTSTPSFSAAASEQTSSHLCVPEPWSDRVYALSLLSDKILKPAESKFAPVIEQLNRSSVDYSACKLLFVEAYIQDFNAMEESYFLDQFFSLFDSQKEIVYLDQMDQDSKHALWEQVIRYLCEAYMGFPADPKPLKATFSSKESEEELEARFDEGMEFLLQFSATDPTETKILFASYLARVINRLEVESQRQETFSSRDLEELFSELYFYAVHLPLKTSKGEPCLISLLKEDLKQMDKKTLHTSLVEKLVHVLKEDHSLSQSQMARLKSLFNEVAFCP